MMSKHHDVCMRTTLTLDDDLAHALKQRARLLDQPFKQVVNDTLRRGLEPASADAPRREYRVRPIHGGFAPGVDPQRLKDLLGEWDDEHYLKVLRGDGSDDS